MTSKTPEQEAIVSFVRDRRESLLIDAGPGSGKTTTLVMAAHAMDPAPTLCLAFNKKIAEEMAKRMPSHIQCATMNSIGHRAWGQHLSKRLTLSTDKSYKLVKAYGEQFKGPEAKAYGEIFPSLLRAVRAAKSAGYIPHKFNTLGRTLISEADFLDSLDTDSALTSFFVEALNRILIESITQSFSGNIDFDDQIYMSGLFGGVFPKYPVIMVDEAQDLSPLNHEMLKLSFKERIIAVGDPNQGIYGFRGAHASSMEVLKETFGMEELTLSVSFRCPRAVVQLCKVIKPNMTSPSWAKEGIAKHLEEWGPSDIPDGAAIICRNNAPLFAVAMKLIRAGRGVKLWGADIGAGMLKLMDKIAPNSITSAEFQTAIDSWMRNELTKLPETKHASVLDRAECLRVFAETGVTSEEAKAYAKLLFSAEGPINLMTGHKSKGLEFETVFFLDQHLIRTNPERNSPDQLKQELNLRFVIMSRAQDSLFFVRSEDFQ